jgi:hypothetical protein
MCILKKTNANMLIQNISKEDYDVGLITHLGLIILIRLSTYFL